MLNGPSYTAIYTYICEEQLLQDLFYLRIDTNAWNVPIKNPFKVRPRSILYYGRASISNPLLLLF
jgi:hypothetical protein